MRFLVALVGVTVIVTLAASGYAVRVAVNERNERIADNTRLIAQNTRRQQRTCERIHAIVDLLDSITPGVVLHRRLAEIDRRYPDIQPCPPPSQ